MTLFFLTVLVGGAFAIAVLGSNAATADLPGVRKADAARKEEAR